MSELEPTQDGAKRFKIPVSFWITLGLTAPVSFITYRAMDAMALLVPIAAIVAGVHFGFLFARQIVRTKLNEVLLGLVLTVPLTVLFVGLSYVGCMGGAR